MGVVFVFVVLMTTIPSLPPSSHTNKSEILYGVENAVGRGVYFMSNVKQRMDIFFDYRAPSIVVDIAEYRNGYTNIRKRGRIYGNYFTSGSKTPYPSNLQ
jgi:hypothetical protein